MSCLLSLGMWLNDAIVLVGVGLVNGFPLDSRTLRDM